jgi:hypothetical protein
MYYSMSLGIDIPIRVAHGGLVAAKVVLNSKADLHNVKNRFFYTIYYLFINRT